MIYRNKKTGAVIDVSSKLNGGDWEADAELHKEESKASEQKTKESATKKAASKTPARKKAVKNNG